MSLEQAKRIDEKNWNTLWGDTTNLELNKINEYITFIDQPDLRELGYT
jgi:hypothetical protein